MVLVRSLVREANPVEVCWIIDVYGELAVLTNVDVEVEMRVKVTRFPVKIWNYVRTCFSLRSHRWGRVLT